MRVDRRLVTLAATDLRGPVLLVAFIGLCTVACWVAQGILVAHALDAVFRTSPLRVLAPFLAALVGVVALRAGLVWLREVAAQWAGLTVKARLRARLMARLLDLGPSYTVGSRTGAVQAVLVDGVEGLDGYYARYLPQLLVAMVGSIGILLYLATLNPLVAAAVAVFVLLVPLAPRLWDKSLGRRGAEHWATYEEVNADYLDAMQGMVTLKSFNAVPRWRSAMEERTWRLYRGTMRQLAVSLVPTGLTGLLVGLGSAAAVVVGVLERVNGRLTGAGLLIVLLLAGECYRPFADLAGYWHLSYLGFSAAGEIGRLLDTQPLPGIRPEGDAVLEPRDGSIELRGVTFGYPGRSRSVLRDLDLRIGSGESVALVGVSGAGKTTILNLVQRFYDPPRGAVLIGGIDARRWDVTALRRTVAVVPQDPYLFHGTVADNIRLGRPDASDQSVRRAAEVAGAAEFIERLPDGYQSRVSERGLTLSGGQRQRIAIARAVLRDAPIVMLDEAMSNVDSETEDGVLSALSALMAGRTTLMITHRLSTARTAGRIVVLRDGQVVESGSHAGLLAMGGDYHRLVRSQDGAA